MNGFFGNQGYNFASAKKWKRSGVGPTRDLCRLCFEEWPQHYSTDLLQAANQEVRALLALGADVDSKMPMSKSNLSLFDDALFKRKSGLIVILLQHYCSITHIESNNDCRFMISYYILQRNKHLQTILFDVSTLPTDIITLITSMFYGCHVLPIVSNSMQSIRIHDKDEEQDKLFLPMEGKEFDFLFRYLLCLQQ